MAKYKCNNQACKAYNKTIEVYRIWTQYKDGIAIDMMAPCPQCKQDRELTEPSKHHAGMCTAMFGGNGNICNK